MIEEKSAYDPSVEDAIKEINDAAFRVPRSELPPEAESEDDDEQLRKAIREYADYKRNPAAHHHKWERTGFMRNEDGESGEAYYVCVRCGARRRVRFFHKENLKAKA